MGSICRFFNYHTPEKESIKGKFSNDDTYYRIATCKFCGERIIERFWGGWKANDKT